MIHKISAILEIDIDSKLNPLFEIKSYGAPERSNVNPSW
jgi:hypothetical protein